MRYLLFGLDLILQNRVQK